MLPRPSLKTSTISLRIGHFKRQAQALPQQGAIEKEFHSLKSEVEIKPVRVWTEDAVHGVLLIGFIAQLMISLTRFFVKPVKRMSTKFIIDALKKLTVTVVSAGNGLKKRFYSNFNEVNRAILADFLSET